MRADERIRTADPFITSEVLYQLSYVGTERLSVDEGIGGVEGCGGRRLRRRSPGCCRR